MKYIMNFYLQIKMKVNIEIVVIAKAYKFDSQDSMCLRMLTLKEYVITRPINYKLLICLHLVVHVIFKSIIVIATSNKLISRICSFILSFILLLMCNLIIYLYLFQTFDLCFVLDIKFFTV